MSYYQYWGKVSKNQGEEHDYHLLPFHCLDVTAAGTVYLENHPGLLTYFSNGLGMTLDQTIKWIQFFLAIHDLGKFSDTFQNLKPDTIQHIRNEASSPQFSVYSVRHDTLGFLCEKILHQHIIEENCFNFENVSVKLLRGGIREWLSSVTGHHGTPPKPKDNDKLKNYFSTKNEIDINKWICDIRSLLLLDDFRSIQKIPDNFTKNCKQMSWWVTGFATIVDWVGSDRIFFQYSKNSSIALLDYFKIAKSSAKDALQAKGLIQAKYVSKKNFKHFYDFEPSPLQKKVTELKIGSGSQLFILEDVTGSGKTEAASMISHCLLALQKGTGIYFGLPTMATADQMFERYQRFYLKLFEKGSAPSLCLSHAKAYLSKDFAKLFFSNPNPEDESYSFPDELEGTASSICNTWFADNSKKALLAEIGVGTIDQALISVLPIKYQSLRMIGLFGKILIVDEVHAYAPYMSGLLGTLLQFHAFMGGSAILLSATLPNRMKQKLVASFSKGVGKKMPEINDDSYPLLTHIGGDSEQQEYPVAPRKISIRSQKIEFKRSETEVIQIILDSIQTGGCVCWIRNTVDDAQQAYQSIKETLGSKFPKESIKLFHARFHMERRLEIQKEVLDIFGNKKGANRFQKILIATQVVEQSLDLDFDVLITDLAPIDLIIQRAGRQHRHTRDTQGKYIGYLPNAKDQREKPILYIHAPKAVDNAPSNWFSSFLPKSASVYENHGQLWKTVKALESKFLLKVPSFLTIVDDARSLIEYVYKEDLEDIPEALRNISHQAEGKQDAERGMAHWNQLKFEQGYFQGWERLLDEADVSTRLGEETTNVVLIKLTESGPIPWCGEGIEELEMSQLRLYQYVVNAVPIVNDSSTIEAINSFCEELPGKGKYLLFLILNKCEDERWEVIGKYFSNQEKMKQENIQSHKSLFYDEVVGMKQE